MMKRNQGITGTPARRLARTLARTVAAALSLALMLGLALNTARAQAQGSATTARSAPDFPSKPVRLIVAFSPGGTLDVMARVLAAQMREVWKQPVIVENRIGANGALGVENVVRSPADGHTLLYNPVLVVVTQQLQKTSFDVLRDLTGVVQTAVYYHLLAAHPKLGVSTIGELLELARREPGKLNYGSGGVGSSLHLYMELLKIVTKVNITHVPYKGSAPAMQALMAGEVDMVFDTTSSMQPLVGAGKVRPLIVTSPKPLERLPSVPTFASAFPGIAMEAGWHGLFAPAATPKAVVEQIAADVRSAIFMPAAAARLREAGFEPTGMGPDRFNELIRSDFERWSKLIRENNIRAD